MSRTESYSSLSMLAECAEKYRLRYVEGLEAPGTSLPAHAGSAMHEAFRILYAEEWDLARAEAALRAAWGDVKAPLGSKHAYLNPEFLALRLQRYMEEREASPTILEEGEVLEGIPETEQTFQWSPRTGRVLTLRVVLDLPLAAGGRYWIVDHKCTTGWVNSHWALQFRIGNQQRLYAAFLQQSLGITVAGALINAVYIGEKANDDAKAWRSRKSSPSMLIRLDFTQDQINETAEWVEGLEAQRDAHAAKGLWPRNERACDAYGGCEFLDLCSAPSEMARKARAMTQFVRREGR